jgi:formylglycine-generating enzyme required for sulfatase activity
VGDTTEVGIYPLGVSAYGVYDMTGNVFEWVADWYDEAYYVEQPSNNPSGPPSGMYKVLRGGSWAQDFDLHSFSRNPSAPSNADNFIGFRCAMNVTP